MKGISLVLCLLLIVTVSTAVPVLAETIDQHSSVAASARGETEVIEPSENGGNIAPTEAGAQNPYNGNGVIYFDSTGTGWDESASVSIYIRSTQGEILPWGSRRLQCSYEGDGLWSWKDSNGYLSSDMQYSVLFTNNDSFRQTYELLFTTDCMGDTVFCTGKTFDYYATPRYETAWRNHPQYQPVLYITESGDAIGKSCMDSPYKMLVTFLKRDLMTARYQNDKDDQALLDYLAEKLGLSDIEVHNAIKEANVLVDWKPHAVADRYGYCVGSYYLVGSINGDNSGINNVHQELKFEANTASDLKLGGIRLLKGDSVRVALYIGTGIFYLYPDGKGKEFVMEETGVYDFYLKPFEKGNPNYWYCEHSAALNVSEYPLGDTDGSGSVEPTDAALVQRNLASIGTPYSDTELLRGDVDQNNSLELTDVTAIQYYLANIETPYAIGKAFEL